MKNERDCIIYIKKNNYPDFIKNIKQDPYFKKYPLEIRSCFTEAIETYFKSSLVTFFTASAKMKDFENDTIVDCFMIKDKFGSNPIYHAN